MYNARYHLFYLHHKKQQIDDDLALCYQLNCKNLSSLVLTSQSFYLQEVQRTYVYLLLNLLEYNFVYR